MVKVIFFGSKPYVEKMFANKNSNYNYTFKFHDFNINEDNASLAKGYDVVCVFVNDYVNAKVLGILKESGCKMLALRCAGYNNVDLEAAKKLGIPVVRVPQYSPYAVAEYAMSLLMTLNRKIHKAYNRVRESNFNINGLLGFDLNGKTIGVIGTGRIGQIFIKISKGFGMNVIAYDLYPNFDLEKELGFKYVQLDELYTNSDIIALHCPLTKENKYLLNKNAFAKMKHNVYIINTSRGGLINTLDLVEALKHDIVGGVALDVYEEEEKYFFEDLSENILDDDTLARLLTFNNVIVTSHQAFFTQEALSNIAETTLNNIKSYLIDNIVVNGV
jgi:D-lactate dehydrogenase